MEHIIPSAFNLVAALCCLCLGIIVLARNHRKLTHQAFAMLAFNFMLWALAVFAVLQSNQITVARYWVGFAEVVACFIPTTFYHFVAYFPRGQFEGSRRLLKSLYAASIINAILTLTPWYVREVSLPEIGPPKVVHGPAFIGFALILAVAVFAMHHNLRRKLRETSGQGRRQTQFVMFGLYSIVALGVLTNLVSELFQIRLFQAYGPVSTVLLMALFAYAMIRYHLLDTRLLVSRLVVFTAMSGGVVLLLVGGVAAHQWLENGYVNVLPVAPILMGGLLIAALFQPAKDRLQSFVEGSLLRPSYDIHQLFTRITEQAAEEVQLAPLLATVAEDIKRTIGVRTIRVLLADEHDASNLLIKFTTVPGELDTETREHGPLLQYLREQRRPLLLEQILHRPPDNFMLKIAQHLADLDAYFCVPLKTNAGLVGILTLGQKESHDAYSVEELTAFRALAGPLGTAIANARLYHELESVNLHLSRVFSQMREGVIAVDTYGSVTTINQAASKILGAVEPNQTLETLPRDVAEVLRETLSRQRPVSDFETEIPGPDGEVAPVMMSSSCLKSPGGETTGAVALIYDLSQIKRLEQNVLRADRLSSIGTLAAGMAHEIKNPLVSIKTFSQLLLNRYADPDFRATFEEVVPHEVDRIDTIVSRLLDFARPRPVKFAPQDLYTVVRGVLALVENQTRKHHVTVTEDFPDNDLNVYGDEQQLHQVFLNLVLNAIDAMKSTRGGNLHIEAGISRVHFRKRGAPSLVPAECVQVRVSDTGCGITQKSMADLFTPFFTTKADGCGLGLAVVHGIVAEHGGEIDVTSMPDRGTTFTVTLPLAHGEFEAESGTSPMSRVEEAHLNRP